MDKIKKQIKRDKRMVIYLKINCILVCALLAWSIKLTNNNIYIYAFCFLLGATISFSLEIISFLSKKIGLQENFIKHEQLNSQFRKYLLSLTDIIEEQKYNNTLNNIYYHESTLPN